MVKRCNDLVLLKCSGYKKALFRKSMHVFIMAFYIIILCGTNEFPVLLVELIDLLPNI